MPDHNKPFTLPDGFDLRPGDTLTRLLGAVANYLDALCADRADAHRFHLDRAAVEAEWRRAEARKFDAEAEAARAMAADHYANAASTAVGAPVGMENFREAVADARSFAAPAPPSQPAAHAADSPAEAGRPKPRPVCVRFPDGTVVLADRVELDDHSGHVYQLRGVPKSVPTASVVAERNAERNKQDLNKAYDLLTAVALRSSPGMEKPSV